MAEQKEAKEKADRDKADYEKKLADGKKKVEELADRFGPWYYVTPGRQLPRRSTWTGPRSPSPRSRPAIRPAMPDFPGGAGMPPGFPPMRQAMISVRGQLSVVASRIAWLPDLTWHSGPSCANPMTGNCH